jgi:hypothetical protein
MRSFALVTCLAILVDPFGALHPTSALAQTTEALEASRAKKARKGEANAPP